MGKKLLALDIDGTSVCDDYSMGEKSKRAIQLAQKKGCIRFRQKRNGYAYIKGGSMDYRLSDP